MKTPATLRLTAAAAIVALAGTAHADRYVPVPQDTMDPLSGDALTGYSAAEQNDLAAQVAGLAGYFDTTVSATVWYNGGGREVTADNIRVTVPILLWENDAVQNAPVIEVLTDGTVAGGHGTFTFLDTAADANIFELNTQKGMVMSFSNVTGAAANNVFLDETFDGSEGDNAGFSRSNSVGQVLPTGVLLWRANFDNDGPSIVNNIEAIDLTGAVGPNNGAAVPPAQTNFLVGSPTLAFGSGVKLLANPGGANPLTDDAGIDSGDDDGGSARLVVPRGEADGNFFDYVGNAWDGAFDGNQNGGLAVGGHALFRNSLAGGTSDVSAPAHAWPTFLGGMQWAPVLPSGASLGDYRNGAALVFELDGSNRLHIAAGYSRTGSSGAGATGEQEILFVDAVTTASAAGNGYSDGAYYFAASPNFQTGFFAGQYTAPMTGAGAPGPDADYRFITTNGNASGGEGFVATPFDINRDGDMVVVWEDRTDTSGTDMGDPFADNRVYEVRLYEAIVGGDGIADDYSAPIVIATNGTGIASRGITYDGGRSIDIPQTIFCDDPTGTFPNGVRGVSNNVPFSGVAIDDQGNIAFTATTQVFTDTLEEDPIEGFPTFAACYDETPGLGNDSVELLEGSTTSLFFYVRAEDALLEMVRGGVGGTELQANVAGSPDSDLSVVLGRFTGDDDSDRFHGTSLADRGFTLTSAMGDNVTSGVATVAFREGNFDRDANNDDDFDDPQGVFLADGTTEEDGGLVIDRTQSGWENQVVTAARGVAVIEFGDIVFEEEVVNSCLADFDNNGVVDLTDFGTFGMEFGRGLPGGGPACTPMNPCVADFDSNGVVDLTDFGTFGMEFGRGLPGGGPGCFE